MLLIKLQGQWGGRNIEGIYGLCGWKGKRKNVQ